MGKIITIKKTHFSYPVPEKQNVILHLKCFLKDLSKIEEKDTTEYSVFSPESYCFSNHKNGLAFNILNGEKKKVKKTTSLKDIVLSSTSSSTSSTSFEILEENEKEVWKKIKQLEQNLHFNNVSSKKSACFWCTFDFENPPIHIPKCYFKESYQVYGCFCSPECATAYLMNETIDTSTKFERYHLLNHIYSKIFNNQKNIKPAPNPFYMLNKFSGNLTIQEYRSLFKTDRLFLVVDKPLSRILPELHEDNEEFILSHKIIPSHQLLGRQKISKNMIMNEAFGLAS